MKEAQALYDEGNDVTVIATRTLAAVDSLDEPVLAKSPWRVNRLDLRSRRVRWFHRFRQMTHARAFWVTGWARFADCGASAFTGPLISAAKRIPADLYIAHYPAALPAAAIAARQQGAQYAFDAEDFHLGDWPDDPEHEPERRITYALEGRYLHRCAYITAASPGIADAYVRAYGVGRPTVVLNVFPRSRAPNAPTLAGTVVPGPSVYWFSQTIGPGRGLECAVLAIGRARTRPHLYLRGSPASGFLERLRAIAIEAGVVDKLQVLPPAPPGEMEHLAAPYDLGLSGEPGHTPNNRIALGNKLFSYILAGVPIVMSDIPAHSVFASQMGEAGKLYRVNDADSLASALDSILGDMAALARARAAAFDLGQTRLNWNVEKTILLGLIKQCTHQVMRPPL
ncbi:MAG TPA: glycosyltransferase [Stellaceae bacterium]|nr:glycosyltransferase [Stellaceae bacterium]